MFALYRTVSYRYMMLRRSRAGLIIISIMLGVALLVATRVLIQSLLKASTESLNPFVRTADLVVMNGETGVPSDMVGELEAAQIPGIAQIEPLVVVDCGFNWQRTIPDRDEPERVLEHVRLVGIRSNLQDRLRGLGDTDRGAIEIQLDKESQIEVLPGVVPEGTRPAKKWNEVLSWEALQLRWWKEKRTPVVLGRELAGKLPDDSGAFSLVVAGRKRDLWAVGTVMAGGRASFLSGKTVVMSDEDASELYFSDPGRQGFRTRIHIMCESGADQAEIRRQVDKVINGRAYVVTPEENDEAFRDISSSLELGFTLIGYLALLVGLFLVYISMTVSVAERRQDIGMLRSLGATRWQVAGLFAGEALCLGIAGSLLGVPLGWALARVGIGPIQAVMSEMFVPVKGSALTLHWGTIVLAFGCGVSTALLAALVPALQAAQEEPADAVRRLPYRSQRLLRIIYVGSCILLFALGIGLLLARRILPERLGGFGSVIALMLAAMAATPLLTRSLSSLAQPLASLLLRLQGRLAADNLARSPARTGLVIAVLAAGVALLIETAGMKVGTERALLGWIDNQMPADLFVTAYSPVTEAGSTLPMQESTATDFKNDPELKDIDHVVGYRMHVVDFRSKIVLAVGFDAEEAYKALQDPKRKAIPGSKLYPRLYQEPDAVLVSENFASQYNVKVGDHIELLGKNGKPFSFHIIGTIDDYTWNRGAVFMDRRLFKEEFGASQVDVFHVYVREGPDHDAAVARVQESLQRKGEDRQLFVLTRPQFRSGLRDLLHRFFLISYAQLLVVGLVVSLGVVAALLISVLQRRRELGLLRAVGASRFQIVMSVLSEALLMGFFGSLIGLGVGILLHWLSLAVLMREESGFVFPFVVPWDEAGIVMLLAMAVATVAGLLPALRAMRLHIAEAIAYE